MRPLIAAMIVRKIEYRFSFFPNIPIGNEVIENYRRKGTKAMKMTKQKSKELVNLSLVVVTIMIFTLFSFSINFIDRVHEYFPLYSTWPINSYYMNVIFLWLMVTLGITYKQWREALRKQNELEDIIASINRDVLIVVDASRTIIRCTASVKRMFAYDVSEVLGRKIDVLYSLTSSVPGEKQSDRREGCR